MNKLIKYCMSITKNKAKLFPNLKKELTVPAKIYPAQYPANIEDHDTSIINHGRPVKLTSPKNQVAFHREIQQNQLVNVQLYDRKWKSPENSYLLKIGIVGPTNSGKSLLMNNLSHHVSAVSTKAQTTSQVIHGIKSYEVNTELGLKNIQLVYYDTPGLFDNKGGIISKGLKVIPQVQFVLMVIDCNKRFDSIIQSAVDRLQKSKQSFSKALVLNKVDLIDSKRRFQTLIGQIEKYAKFDKIFYTSAETGYGINQLTEYLIGMAKPEKWLYPAQTRTTLSHRQIYEELMKQAFYSRTYEEIPHRTSISCDSIAERTNSIPLLHFKIQVDSENQQRLVLGTKGKNLLSMINKFKVLCAKLDNQIPDVEVQVSIRSKTRRRIESIESIILPQNYNVIEAENESGILKGKSKAKLSKI